MKDTEKSAELIVRLAQRLADPDDPLIGNVRHLKIGPTREDLPSNRERRYLPKHEYRSLPKGLLVQHVTNILENLRNLTDFSWHIYNKVPRDILYGVETRWPNCRLHAYYPDANHRQLHDFDNEFLCSPQLHTLEVQTIDFVDPRDGWGQLEFSHLGHLLGKHGCIKVLRLLQPKCINPSSHIGSVFNNDPVWLESDQLKFPVLEELVIPHVHYGELFYGPLKLGHEWWKKVDWSVITKLDVGEIGHNWSGYLAGRVAQVRSLSFKYSTWQANQWDIGSYVNNSKNLLASIAELQEVSCYVDQDETDSDWAAIWDTLLLKQGKSLRKLAMKTQCFTATIAKQLIDQTPNLEELDVVIKIPGLGEPMGYDDDDIIDIFQDDNVKALAGLSSLQKLKLTIPMEADHLGLMEYVMKYETQPHRSSNIPIILKVEDCEQQVRPIFEAFLMQQAESKIDTIEVQFDCAFDRERDSYYPRLGVDYYFSWNVSMQRNYSATWKNDNGEPYSVRFRIKHGNLILKKTESKEPSEV